MKKILFALLMCISVARVFAMAMEQYEYTITSYARDVKVSFAGKSVEGRFKKAVVLAPYSNTIDFEFPESKNIFRVPRTNLPGNLNIKIHKFAKGQYTIVLSDPTTGEQNQIHIDIPQA